MASSAQIAANRLNAQEGTEPRDARGRGGDAAEPLRHPPAELGGTALPNRLGADPAKISTLG